MRAPGLPGHRSAARTAGTALEARPLGGPRWSPLLLVVLIGLAAIPAAPRGAGPATAQQPVAVAAGKPALGAWATIELPGTEDQLLGVIGLGAGMPRARIVPALIRAIHGAPPGSDRAAVQARARLADHFRQAPPTGPAIRVPLPLGPESWTGGLVEGASAAEPLGVAILDDRAASWLFLALSSMDPESAGRLVSVLPGATLRREAAVLTVVGRSLVIRSDGVAVPGGVDAAPIWEGLVGERASDPGRFLERLLARDGGMLAHFYDVVASLDPPHQRFALHLAVSPESRRQARVATLYSAFLKCEPSWRPRERPFNRPSFDGEMLLALVEVGEDGRPVGPWRPSGWTSVFSPAQDPALTSQELDDPDSVDAALLASVVLVPSNLNLRQARLETVLFGQRVFGAADPASWRQLVPILREFWRRRSLLLVLERIGVTDPSTYETAMGSAERLDRITDRRDRAVAYAEFQGLLALIDHLACRAAIGGEAVRKLAQRAVSLVPGLGDRYQGQIAGFIDTALLPALSSIAAAGLGADNRVLAGLAGPRPALAPPLVSFEGQRYRVDPAAAEQARLRSARAALGSASLGQAIEFSRLARTFAFEPGTAENARALASRLAASAAGLERVAPPSAEPLDARAIGAVLAEVGARARRIVTDRDLRRTLAVSRPLLFLADAITAESLAGLAYAVEIADPSSTMLGLVDAVATHDFGLAEARSAGEATRAAWALPREVKGHGRAWRVAGSLLAMDAALASFGLRRLSTDRFPGVPRLSSSDRQTFAHSLALLRPVLLDERTAEAITAGLRRGQNRIAEASVDAQAAADLALAVGGDWWRAQAARWSANEAPEQVESLFSLSDQLRIGAPELAADRLGPWGLSALALGGGLGQQYPDGGDSATFAGRPAMGIAATRVPDLHLRVAAELAERGLPATLAPAVVAYALPDYLDEVQPADGDDWLTLATSVRAIPAARFEDYIAALTARGPLVPIRGDR